DLPPYRTAFHYFRLWQADGTWDRIHDALRTQVRQAAGKKPKPTAAILDSQSVKTTEQGGPRGLDAGKKSQRPQAVRGGWHAGGGGGAAGGPRQRTGPRRRHRPGRSAAGGGAGGSGAVGRRALRHGPGARLVPLGLAGGGRQEVGRAGRLRRAEEALDRGADVRVAQPLPPPVQGLRADDGQQ